MSDHPQISIVTPALNSEATIRRTIESVFNEQFENLEYWIIDGGSTDETFDIVKSFGSLVHMQSEADDGIADAFNKGVERCSGELVGIINSDDWYSSGVFERVANAYKGLPRNDRSNTIFHGDLQVHNKSTSYLQRPRIGRSHQWHWSFYFEMPVNHPTCFVPKALYDRVGLYNTDYRIAMDFEWILRAWRQGAKFHYIPDVLANFQAGGVSTRNTRTALAEVYRGQLTQKMPFLTTFASYVGKLAVNRLKVLLDSKSCRR